MLLDYDTEPFHIDTTFSSQIIPNFLDKPDQSFFEGESSYPQLSYAREACNSRLADTN